MPIHTYKHLHLINHRHSRSPLLLPLLSTLSALCVVAAHFILILVLRLFRNNRNIRCDRDVDCAAAVVSDLASIFSVSVAALPTPSPPSHSLCWLANLLLFSQRFLIFTALYNFNQYIHDHHTHSHLQRNLFICLFIANYSQNRVREISIQQQQQREYLQLLLQLEQSNNNNN